LTDVATKGTHAKGAEKKLRGKIQEIMYRDTTIKGKFGNHTRKTSNRFTAKELYLEHHM